MTNDMTDDMTVTHPAYYIDLQSVMKSIIFSSRSIRHLVLLNSHLHSVYLMWKKCHLIWTIVEFVTASVIQHIHLSNRGPVPRG